MLINTGGRKEGSADDSGGEDAETLDMQEMLAWVCGGAPGRSSELMMIDVSGLEGCKAMLLL